MKDEIGKLFQHLFAQDKKSHPMPPKQANALLRKIKRLLRKSQEDL